MTFGNRKEDFDPQPSPSNTTTMSHTETTEAVLNFPHQDDNNWLMIDVGGVKAPQYPSPLEVKMLLTTIRKETLEEVLDTSWDWIVEAARKEEWMREDYKQYVRDRIKTL